MQLEWHFYRTSKLSYLPIHVYLLFAQKLLKKLEYEYYHCLHSYKHFIIFNGHEINIYDMSNCISLLTKKNKHVTPHTLFAW